MNSTKVKRKERLKIQSLKFQSWIEDVFSSKKKTFLFLAIFVFTILFVIDIAIILINNSFYNNFSDDILQYYSIMNDFIAQVKDGTISWFNLNNYLGASFFSDIYYIPIDIFTLITFLLSYVMPTEIAYSSTELIKILAGVMIFAYYLSLQGMKNRTIFWMGIIYFISGGSVSFMAFPVFLSLAFYLPLSLVVIHFFFHKKRWIVPLYALMVIFYDFYLGYMALAFISIMFIVEYFKRPGFNFFKFIKEGVIFLGLILIGVGMSLIILYPSILFVLEDTFRQEGSFNSWIVNIGSFELKLFQPTIYVRAIAKIFTEQKGIGFYGFESNYGTEHFSLFITVIGFAYMNYIYFMKGRIARVYKILIPFGMVLIFFPLFSFVFSGTLVSPYTRWINVYPLVEVMILAHVFDQYGFEKVKMKFLTIPIVVMLLLDAFTIQYYLKKLGTDTTYTSRDVLTADTVLMFIAAVVLILLLIFGWLKKHKAIKIVFWVEFAIAIGYVYSGPFAIPNKIDTFETMHSVNDYLNEVLDQNEFYRVYVDLSRLDVEPINFNRMTTFATNTQIFHSWTDSETKAIGKLLFNADEDQSKNKLEIQAIYLNQFLGYKYILVSAEYDYYLPSTFYTLKYANTEYRLYEIVNASSFNVYESYTTYSKFRSISSVNKATSQKLLLVTALLDNEDARFDFTDINLESYTATSLKRLDSVTSYMTISSAELVSASGVIDKSERNFYKYGNEELNIGFDAGAIYLKSTDMSIEAYKEVFMEFSDGSTSSCTISSDMSHQVKCEFWSEPVAIYFEETNLFNEPKVLEYRLECAIDSAAYLVYDLSNINFLREEGMLYFALSSTVDFERVFVEDIDGNITESFNGYLYFNTRPVRMYIYKTSKMYEQSDLFDQSLKYAYDDLSFYEENSVSSIAKNKYLTIDKGVIHVKYD
ncbi:MAG: YfhO family protein, partial [Candidatus Izemoplasmatales bacterium]|nr:YfhO family protein [Candidatus Izemoplasmatales bacterium]